MFESQISNCSDLAQANRTTQFLRTMLFEQTGERDRTLTGARMNLFAWGCSSVGRAVALQAIGQEFESPQLHQLLLAARTRLRATLASSGRELRPAKSVFSRSGV